MPDITNQDVINAIRGMYQGPNKVSDVVLQQKVDQLLTTLGAQADAAQTNPNAAASALALLKGLLKQLQGTGTGAAPVQLTGSNLTEAQALWVKETGSKSKIINGVETIINAQTVPAGGNTGFASFDSLGASLVFLLINSDQPWHAFAKPPYAPVDFKLLYPDVSTANQPAKSLLNFPRFCLYTWAAPDGFGSATSLADAIAAAAAWETGQSSQSMGIKVCNDGTGNATVTVRLLRIWR